MMKTITVKCHLMTNQGGSASAPSLGIANGSAPRSLGSGTSVAGPNEISSGGSFALLVVRQVTSIFEIFHSGDTMALMKDAPTTDQLMRNTVINISQAFNDTISVLQKLSLPALVVKLRWMQ